MYLLHSKGVVLLRYFETEKQDTERTKPKGNTSEPQVSFYDDRIEIVTDDGLPFGLTREEFSDAISKIINERLMDVFNRVGIINNGETDISSVLHLSGKEVFDINESVIKITIPFNKEVNKTHEEDKDTQDEYVFNDRLNILSNDEIRVYKAIQSDPNITAKEISDNFGIAYRSVQRYISNLKAKGLIKRVGANKNGHWEKI